MDADFWLNAWDKGSIGFHRSDYHPELLKYFKHIKPKGDDKILVPLCGKSKDMLFLHDQGLKITGVEFSNKACEEFFSENELEFLRTDKNNFDVFEGKAHTLYCGDYFSFDPGHKYDAAYDRAAIVALDPKSRTKYAKQYAHLLNKNGKLLLLSFEYDQSKVQGPPFSVEEYFIRELFENEFEVEVLESKAVEIGSPRFIEAGVIEAVQKSYLLTKK